MFFDQIPPRKAKKPGGGSKEIESEVRFILNSKKDSDAQRTFDFMNVRRKGAKEIESFLKENSSVARPVRFGNLVSIFSEVPFRFSEREIIAATAELFADGAVVLRLDEKNPQGAAASRLLAGQDFRDRLTLYANKETGKEDLERAAEQGRLLFDREFDLLEGPLVEGLKRELKNRRDISCRILDETRGVRFPGEGSVYNGRRIVHCLLSISEHKDFVRFFNENKDGLVEFEASFSELIKFRENFEIWKKLIESLAYFKPNLPVLENDSEAKQLYDRMVLVSSSSKPSAFFGEIHPLIARLERINDRMVGEIRERVVSDIEERLKSLQDLLRRKKASPRISNESLRPLRVLLKKTRSERFLPDLEKIARDAAEHCEESAFLIGEERDAP